MTPALDILAQVKIHERESGHLTCVQQNGICPNWIVDHFHDYLAPTLAISPTAIRRRRDIRPPSWPWIRTYVAALGLTGGLVGFA